MHVGHLQRSYFAVRTKCKAGGWHRCDPIQALGRNGRMKVMDLVRGDRRSLEYGQSGVGENGLMRLACRPVFAGHITVVGRGSAPGEAITPIIRTHAVEAVAARQLSLK